MQVRDSILRRVQLCAVALAALNVHTRHRAQLNSQYDSDSARGLEGGVMTAFDLRPLNLGEILDRTFTLYRRNFLLFIGISAIPHVLVLVLNLLSVSLTFSG